MESTSSKRVKSSGRRKMDRHSYSHEPAQSSQHEAHSEGGNRRKKRNRTHTAVSEESVGEHEEYPEQSSLPPAVNIQGQLVMNDRIEPYAMAYDEPIDDLQNSSPPSHGSVAAHQGSGADSNSPTSVAGFDTVATNDVSRWAIPNTSLRDSQAEFANSGITDQDQLMDSSNWYNDNSQPPWTPWTLHSQHDNQEVHDVLWSLHSVLPDATNGRTH